MAKFLDSRYSHDSKFISLLQESLTKVKNLEVTSDGVRIVRSN